MKKTSSLVWRFFDRLEENKRCVAVLCKLCDTQYRYFGNTTNLRTHLINKHPIQWDLLQNGTLEETSFRTFDDDESTNQTTTTVSPRQKRRKYVKNYKNDNVRYSVSVDLNKRQAGRNDTEEKPMPVIEIQRVDVLENSGNETDHNADDILVRQLHNNRNSDEEWLEEEVYQAVDSYEPKRKKMKVKHIKREVQSPPIRRASNYIVQPSKSYSKPTERIYIGSPPRNDEYTVFGEYVANKLRKYKGPQTRGNIQQLITTILWQAEYGMYDNMESVKRIILHSVQDMESEQPAPESQVPEHQGEETQVQMLIEHRGDDHITEEPIRIIDAPSSE